MSVLMTKLLANNKPINDSKELIMFIKKNGGRINSTGEDRIKELFENWGESRFKKTRSRKFPFNGLPVDIVYTGNGPQFVALFYVKNVKLIGFGYSIGSNAYNITWKDENWDLLDDEISLDEKRGRDREF